MTIPTLDDFDYDLPKNLIAQFPAEKRSDSRMLVMSRADGGCRIHPFLCLPEYLKSGDCLVINDTRVFPARLHARRMETGGGVEVLALEELESENWECMLKPGRRMKAGEELTIDHTDGHVATVVGRHRENTFEVSFNTPDAQQLFESAGSVPLPPYIARESEKSDHERYQTVYSDKLGSVAAPTAGLHFTELMLEEVRNRGVAIVNVTLHVGPGTFRPVQTNSLEEHKMHEERFELTQVAAAAINKTKDNQNRVIAVGTTSVRVLETCATEEGRVVPQQGRTGLFMHPPMRPQVTDGLLTNFHLPKSTLLMLVSTFSNVENVMAAYRQAVNERMRFYSYGDCMLIV